MTRIEYCLRACANFMNRFHLPFVGLFLCGLLIAFAPVAAGQTPEKVLYNFAGNGIGPVSNVIRDSAGNFYGETLVGGSGFEGTVFKVDPTGHETVLYNFTGNPVSNDGGQPIGGLVMDSAGNLYGTTASGGNDFGGTVFKVDPAGNVTFLVLFNPHFPTNGLTPEAGLIIDSAGNLYGTTYSGGSGNVGTVFKLSPTTGITVLYNFTGINADGANPAAALTMDTAGNLYGTTLHGGSAGEGIVFKLDPTGKETVLHSFTGISGDGANPGGTLVIDGAGNLYGTTLNGGSASKGIVFKLDSTGTETVLYSFTGTNGDGANPQSGLVIDSSGNLFGTLASGGTAGKGIVFKVDPTGLETVLHSFTGTSGDGSEPLASLTQDSAGNLYGTTWLGGTSGGGTIFQLNSANQETVLFSFAGLNGDGAGPSTGLVPPSIALIQDSAGNLYGTTGLGGASAVSYRSGAGTVFKLDPTGKETVLHRIAPCDPSYLVSCATNNLAEGYGAQGLIMDSAGNLYGTTYDSGTLGYGNVFKVDPTGNETVVYSFTGVGGRPQPGFVQDSAGNLYGTLSPVNGAGTGNGNVYKLNPNTGQQTVLYSFTGTNGDGNSPNGGLIRDSAGNLYGTTTGGGVSGYGTVFKVDPTGHETVLYSFTGANGDGAIPEAGVIMDPAGNLYGTTYGGGLAGSSLCGNGLGGPGSDCGTVFKLDPTGHETVLYSFTGANGDGANPEASLVLDGAGNLYGTTPLGGTNDNGIAFKVDPTGHETVLHLFGVATGDGIGPGALTLGSGGNLYGTTTRGGTGTFGQGTIFVLTLSLGDPTSTALVSSLNPSQFGQSVTFTATVTAQAAGTPTGTVTFLDGGATLGTGTLNASAQAAFTTASLAVGTHSIVAQYGGDSTFASSSSTSLSQQVLATAQLRSITVSPNPASVAVGHTLQFMATGHYSDGSTRDLTTAVTWSSDHKTATISNSPGSQGLATGVEVERGIIITASQGTISGTAKLNVTPH